MATEWLKTSIEEVLQLKCHCHHAYGGQVNSPFVFEVQNCWRAANPLRNVHIVVESSPEQHIAFEVSTVHHHFFQWKNLKLLPEKQIKSVLYGKPGVFIYSRNLLLEIKSLHLLKNTFSKNFVLFNKNLLVLHPTKDDDAGNNSFNSLYPFCKLKNITIFNNKCIISQIMP